MFKELAMFGMICILVFLVFRRIYGINRPLLRKILIGLLALSAVINVIYNLKYIYPEYIYEGVPIGDSRENLFVYKEDSEFQWQILFPILKGRKVFLDTSDDFYDEFFELYAKDVEHVEISDSVKDTVIKDREDFGEKISMSMVELLNYAFEPRDCALYEERYPKLYIQMDSIKGKTELYVIIDHKSNLYMMSKEQYESIG